MSLIRLDTYIVVKEDNSIIHGRPLADSPQSELPADKIRVGIDSVKLPARKKAPANGLMMLYGFRDSLQEMTRQRLLLTKNNPAVHFHPVSIDFDVGDIYPGIVPMQLVAKQRFLNIKRSSAEVQKEIRSRFETFIEEEGGSVQDIKRIQQIAGRPDLFGRLIESEPFSNVEILVFPVLTDNGLRQFAMVTHKACMVELIQNPHSRIIAVPPDWLAISRQSS